MHQRSHGDTGVLSSVAYICFIISYGIAVSCTLSLARSVHGGGGGGGGSVRRRCIHSRYWFAINQDYVYQGPMSCLMPYYNRVYRGETEPPLLPFLSLNPRRLPIFIFSSTVNISTPHIAALSLNNIPFVTKVTVRPAHPPYFHCIYTYLNADVG